MLLHPEKHDQREERLSGFFIDDWKAVEEKQKKTKKMFKALVV